MLVKQIVEEQKITFHFESGDENIFAFYMVYVNLLPLFGLPCF